MGCSTSKPKQVFHPICVEHKRSRAKNSVDTKSGCEALAVQKHLMLSGRFDGGEKEAFIRKLYKALASHAEKLRPYIVEAKCGQEFGEMTDFGLANMYAMVCVAYDDYGQKTGSPYCSFCEIRYARNEGIPMLPVKMCKEWPPQTPHDHDGGLAGRYMVKMAFIGDLVRVEGYQQVDFDCILEQVVDFAKRVLKEADVCDQAASGPYHAPAVRALETKSQVEADDVSSQYRAAPEVVKNHEREKAEQADVWSQFYAAPEEVKRYEREAEQADVWSQYYAAPDGLMQVRLQQAAELRVLAELASARGDANKLRAAIDVAKEIGLRLQQYRGAAKELRVLEDLVAASGDANKLQAAIHAAQEIGLRRDCYRSEEGDLIRLLARDASVKARGSSSVVKDSIQKTTSRPYIKKTASLLSSDDDEAQQDGNSKPNQNSCKRPMRRTVQSKDEPFQDREPLEAERKRAEENRKQEEAAAEKIQAFYRELLRQRRELEPTIRKIQAQVPPMDEEKKKTKRSTGKSIARVGQHQRRQR